jgi:hypothetical protein
MAAAAGTTLPVGVTSSTSAFTKLGLVADDGLRPSGQRTSTDIFDWAGDLIYSPQDQHSTQFQFKLYAAFDADVLSEVFGEENVSTVGSLITVLETGSPLPVHPWLFDLKDGIKRVRIPVPAGQITNVVEGPFVRNALQSFDVTLTCYKDDNGRKAYRYYDDGSSPAAPAVTSHSPAGSVGTAGGDILYLTGTNFTGTTGATVDGTAVLDFVVVDDQHLIITVPAKAAGSRNLLVTNATGTSTAYALTYA